MATKRSGEVCHLKDRSLNAKTGVSPLTAVLSEEIESMLNDLK